MSLHLPLFPKHNRYACYRRSMQSRNFPSFFDGIDGSKLGIL